MPTTLFQITGTSFGTLERSGWQPPSVIVGDAIVRDLAPMLAGIGLFAVQDPSQGTGASKEIDGPLPGQIAVLAVNEDASEQDPLDGMQSQVHGSGKIGSA